MRAVWATFTRELRAYFFSPLAYVVMFFFLVVNGFIFSVIAMALSDPRSAAGPPLESFFGGFLFWIILLIMTPILTMRLVSEELRSGTVEVLMTAPVTEGQVVAGKYLAVLAFYACLWAPTLAYAGVLAYNSKVDWGPVASGYVGILGIGALFLAVGTFGSAVTKSQLVAAIITFALLVLLFVAGLIDGLFNGETIKQALGYLNLVGGMEDFSKGIIDTRRLVYYASASWFFLFLASRALADKKWR